MKTHSKPHRDWQFLSRAVVKLAEEGSGFLLLDTPFADPQLLASHPDVFLWRKVAQPTKITAKDVRRFFWTNRGDRAFHRPYPFVWWEGDRLGLGTMTTMAFKKYYHSTTENS